MSAIRIIAHSLLPASILLFALQPHLSAQTTTRVDLSSSGVVGNGDCAWASLSPDARYVVFRSFSDNLVTPDTNGSFDIFLRDRQASTTVLVSQSTQGVQSSAFCSFSAVSADGRYVVFASQASNFVAGDTNGVGDVFLRDVVAGTTIRVSQTQSGIQGDQESGWPGGVAISADGRWVAFASAATNLVPNDTNGLPDIFLYDRTTGALTRVSVATNGQQGTGTFGCFDPSLSADGRYIAFDAAENGLDPSDGNVNGTDIYVHDRQTGVTQMVGRNSQGVQGNLGSSDPSISADGRYVAFTSWSTNLDSIPNGAISNQVYLRDLVAGTTRQVSVDSFGVGANDGSAYPSISADGRHVAFESFATNLVPSVSAYVQVYTHDAQTGETQLVSVSTGGAGGDNNSDVEGGAAISSDGRYVAFTSYADNLVTGDVNGCGDAFLRDEDPAIDAYCNPGYSGVIACPCGNSPVGPSHGCDNSLGTGGASIQGWGSPSLAADSVVVAATGIGSRGASCSGSQSNLTCILLQGSSSLPAGVAFHDGVRCVAGSLKRIETATSSAGTFTSSVGISARSAALGDTIPAGSMRYYSVWYRDPCPAFACASPANTSNALRIRWAP